MTREDVLEKSRQEHKTAETDEREASILVKAGDRAGVLSLLLCVVLGFINAITDGPEVVTHSLWAVYWSRQAYLYGYQAYHLKKRSYWFYCALLTVTCLGHVCAFLWLSFGRG